MSDFPDGITSLVLRGQPITQTYPGEVFWANSTSVLAKGGVGGSDGNPGTYKKPFATIDGAMDKCVASRGDIIVVMPGHTETVSTATSIVCDKAGVAVIGLGSGTLRPKISFSAAAGSIVVSAANVSWKNIVFSAEFADVAEAFTPSAVSLTVEGCVFQDDATDENFVEIVDTGTTDNECDDLAFIGCTWISPDASATSWVNVDADLDGLTFHDCWCDLAVNGVISLFAEVAAGKDLTNVDFQRNYGSRLVTASAVGYITFADTTTTNTGLMKDNSWRSLDIADELLLTAGTNITTIDNKATSVINKSGYLLPVADS